MSDEKKLCAWFRARSGRTRTERDLSASPTAGRPGRIYGFGALTFIVLVLVTLSGLYLAMFYLASPGEAWKSVVFIEDDVRLGHFARSLHRWGAFTAMLLVLLHVMEVVYLGAYRAPRALNWFSGLVLLILTVCMVVTGYMLPWNFKAYWVVKTLTNWLESLPLFSGPLHWLLYGDAPNGLVPLGRWFAIHIMVLPMFVGAFLTAHYALFRKHGSAKSQQ